MAWADSEGRCLFSTCVSEAQPCGCRLAPGPQSLQPGHRGGALFYSFPDQEVRRMAVQWIGSLSDAELLDYLPQLVQVSRPPLAPSPCASSLGNPGAPAG